MPRPGLPRTTWPPGRTVPLTNYLADPVEMNILHMVTGDPKRTGTFALFANPDFWLSSGSASCGSSCVSEPSGQDAWNHGDVAPEINTTWLGLVGPGVAHAGVNNAIWSDHTDIQPTMMALLGLNDDYTPDGVVLGDVIEPMALPPAMLTNYPTLTKLSRVYTQLEAAVGEFGLDTLAASTRALASNSPGDATYTSIENQLTYARRRARRPGRADAGPADRRGVRRTLRSAPGARGEAHRPGQRPAAQAVPWPTDSGPRPGLRLRSSPLPGPCTGYVRQMRTSAQSSEPPPARCRLATRAGAPALKPLVSIRSASPSRRSVPASMSRPGASTSPSV